MDTCDMRSVAADCGVHLNDEQVAYLEGLARLHPNCPDWRMWMKKRLANMGFLRAKKKGCSEVAIYTVLHVFNIHRKDVLPSTGQFLFSTNVARSKVIRGVVVPTPMDRLAWMVAPDPERKAIAKMRRWLALD